jgi:manganese-dependent ADP-ribose/CDP-alcohol diphosphatase
MKINRRLFVLTLGLGLCLAPALAQPPTLTAVVLEQGGTPLFRFGLFADVQYADKEAQGPRHYRESAAKLKACVADFNQRELAFVVNLGDLIDGQGAQSEPQLKQMLELLKPLRAPLHHVIGNHCLEVERPALMRALHLSSPYYGFQHQGWRFVVLDGMDVSLKSAPESAEVEAAHAWLRKNPNLPTYNGALGQRQLAWLKQELAEAQQRQQRVMVFCHHPLEVSASDASSVLWNHAEVAKLLAGFGCVAAWFNGHDHRGGYAARNGIHHVTLPGIVEAPADGKRYAVVEVYADRLILRGLGDVPQRSLYLHP